MAKSDLGMILGVIGTVALIGLLVRNGGTVSQIIRDSGDSISGALGAIVTPGTKG